MGWGTTLFCNIYFHKETFNSKYDVQERIDEVTACLDVTKRHLHSLVVMTEPNKFVTDDETDPLYWVENECNRAIEDIREYTMELYRLNLLLDNWDACHTKEGLAIDPPEGVSYDTAFLEGDYVNSVKYPDNR